MKVRLKHQALAQLLARKSVTQNRWAQMLGLSRGHLSDLVNGRHIYPTPRTRQKLLQGLKADFEDLFEVEIPPEKASRPTARKRPALQPTAFRGQPFTGGEKKMHTLLEDLRNAVRMLTRAPAFTAIALTTLALGIGANTAIFSVVHGVLFESLPFPQSHRLVFLPRQGDSEADVSIPDGMDIRAQCSTVQEVALFIPFSNFDLVGRGEPERLQGAVVEPQLFDVLGVMPLKGRLLQGEDNRPGADPVAVISEGLWNRRFGRAEDIVGRTVTLSGQSITLVGVVPSQLDFLENGTELWVPVATGAPWAVDQRGSNNFEALARLKEAASLEQANAELSAVTGRLAEQYPRTNRGKILRAVPLDEFLTGPVRPALLLLLAAVGLVLLIACINLSNLLLLRAAKRQSEMSVRLALGGSPARILRQLLCESLWLAAGGGAAGLLLAWWGMRWIVSMAPEQLPRTAQIGFDWPVVAFAALASLTTALLVGLIPAAQTARNSAQGLTSLSSSRSSGGKGRQRMVGALVVCEVTLAFMLLVGAGLLIRTLMSLQAVDLGFESKGRLEVNLVLNDSTHGEIERQTLAFEAMLQSLHGISGVKSAAFVIGAPLAGWGYIGNNLILGDRPIPADSEMPSARNRPVLGDYFRTMGIPILRGRGFTDQDHSSAPPVAVVNRSFAERFWPHGDPLGKRVAWRPSGDRPPRWMTIVGVAEDVRSTSLAASDSITVYTAYPQRTDSWQRFGTLVIHAQGSLEALAQPIREAIWKVDKTLPVPQVVALQQLVEGAMVRESFLSFLLGIFAAVATLIALQGIYGVLSSAFAQRRREIGIRMALGARKANIVRLVLQQGTTLAATGVALGTAGALLLSRLLAGMLFGVTATDPLTFLLVSAALLCMALLACYLPARRASVVDPAKTLRWE